jgi:hypothetical protein
LIDAHLVTSTTTTFISGRRHAHGLSTGALANGSQWWRWFWRQNSYLHRVTKFELLGSERRFKDLHFRTEKQQKKILSLISLFEHKLDNNFGTRRVLYIPEVHELVYIVEMELGWINHKFACGCLTPWVRVDVSYVTIVCIFLIG